VANADLETRYRAYLVALNERRLDDLVRYVQDELSYNGERMTRRQYQDLIAADLTAIPDLIFDAQIILASGDQVACRLVFDCIPQHEFLGFSPNGERLCVAEHVFYHFRDGRIAAELSLIDSPSAGPTDWSWRRRTRRPRGKSAVDSDVVDAMEVTPSTPDRDPVEIDGKRLEMSQTIEVGRPPGLRPARPSTRPSNSRSGHSSCNRADMCGNSRLRKTNGRSPHRSGVVSSAR
jgi:predicted ester cyclase